MSRRRQSFPDSAKQGFFIEGLEQGRDRVSFAHHFPGPRIVAAGDQDCRQLAARLGQGLAKFNPGHSRHVNVEQEAGIAGWTFTGQEVFSALKVEYVEAEDLQLPSQSAADRRIIIYDDYRDCRFIPQLTIPAAREL